MIPMLMTVFTAVAAVFIIMLVWVGIDRLANKSLGERNRCCHSFDPDAARAQGGCCGKHTECSLNEEQDPNRPACTIHQ